MTKDKGMASHPGFKFQLNPSFILSIHLTSLSQFPHLWKEDASCNYFVGLL